MSQASLTTGRRLQRVRGGFLTGAITGLLLGLAVALAVAIYVNKVPIPFVDKVPMRTAEQDAAEAEKNRNWDPNAPLYSKAPTPPAPPADNRATVSVPYIDAASAALAAQRAGSGAEAAKAPDSAERAGTAKAEPSPFLYYVQVGAYARSDDAEQQRAKLGMVGLIGRVTEREQAGRLVYRVRMGPFDNREEAEGARDQSAQAGFSEAALVRVQR